MRATNPIPFLTLAILCCGCSTNPPVLPEKFSERRAHISGGSGFSLTEGASLASIDGKTLLFGNSADLAPGSHVARVCLDGLLSGYLKCEDLRFVAEVGHEYIVRGSSEGFLDPVIHLWIEDARSGQVVAGERP